MSGSLIWVISLSADDDILGRLGDARDLADRCGSGVGFLRIESTQHPEDEASIKVWIEHGAEDVHVVRLSQPNSSAALEVAEQLWHQTLPRLILFSAEPRGRAWSARLAARRGWPLISPALMLQWKQDRVVVTRLDRAGRRAQFIDVRADRPAIVGLRPGVAQPLLADPTRQGTVHRRDQTVNTTRHSLTSIRCPADPQTADIRHVPKLVSGGKGVGSKAGFELLRRIAAKLGAGIAASRMAVDLGWMESERQVGQTGKTVRPELYLACGISGASHHLDGMSESRHVVAINTDPQAPLMQQAELALQADLHATLAELDRLLEATV